MSFLDIINPASGLAKLVSTVLDKIKLDPSKKAEIELAMAQNEHELKKIEADLEARLAEAASANIRAEVASNSWLSKNSRPMFLFIGSVAIWMNPIISMVAQLFGRTIPLIEIPPEIYWLYGSGFLGYVGARSFEKTWKMKR